MTTITYKETLEDLEITVSGHSGYAKVGSDIVCASISTAIILTKSLLLKLKYRVFYEENEEVPEIKIRFSNYKTTKPIFENLISFFYNLQIMYKNYVEVKEIK